MRLRLPKNTKRLVLTAAAIVLVVYLIRILTNGNLCDCSNCSVQSGGTDPAITKTDTTSKPTTPTTTSTTPTVPATQPTEAPSWVGIIAIICLVCVIAGLAYYFFTQKESAFDYTAFDDA